MVGIPISTIKPEEIRQVEGLVALPGGESAFFGIMHLAGNRVNTALSGFVSPVFAT